MYNRLRNSGSAPRHVTRYDATIMLAQPGEAAKLIEGGSGSLAELAAAGSAHAAGDFFLVQREPISGRNRFGRGSA